MFEGLAATNERVHRGWLYVDRLRAINRAPDPAEAALMLTADAAAIVNAIQLGISNAASTP